MMALAILEEANDELFNSDQGAVGENEDHLVFSQVDAVSDMLLLVQSSRYLVARERISSSTQLNADIFRESIPNSRFRQRTRMDKSSFERVVNEIKDNPVFHYNSRFPQAPAWLQLAVALDRFGNYGSGASLSRSQGLWGTGKGPIDAYTDRVVTALNDLSAQYVRWPSGAERTKISRRMTSTGFRGCVGFIDGTTIPLCQKPAVDGECCFDRKQRYRLNAQVVCDDRRRIIIAFYTGWPGSCSDSTIYQEISLSKNSLKIVFSAAVSIF